MTIYNVLVGVVDLIDAQDEAAAIADLKQRLTAADFDVYDGMTPLAFESEEQP